MQLSAKLYDDILVGMLCNKATMLFCNSDHFVAFSLLLHADGEAKPLFISVFDGHDMPLHAAEECRTHTSLWL